MRIEFEKIGILNKTFGKFLTCLLFATIIACFALSNLTDFAKSIINSNLSALVRSGIIFLLIALMFSVLGVWVYGVCVFIVKTQQRSSRKKPKPTG